MKFIKWLLSFLSERKLKCGVCKDLLQENETNFCGECIDWNSMNLG